MAQAQEIKNRLRSIKNTQKTTKAMELVSGAKMRRAVEAVSQTRSYYTLLWDLLDRVRSKVNLTEVDILVRFFDFELLPEKTSEPQHTTIVCYTSNRGLCGAFNSNVIKKVLETIETYGKENIDVVAIGKKGVNTLTSLGIHVSEAYEKDDSAKDDTSLTSLVKQLMLRFKNGETDRIIVVYTDYKSPLIQKVVAKQLFPITKEESIGERVMQTQNPIIRQQSLDTYIPYSYEPSSIIVLEYILPRIAEVQMYQALLESNASEHSSRMIAMKNATDNAKEMGDELTLIFNRARQASITQEIAEISAGAASVS